MRVLVAVKRVVDHNVRVRPSVDGLSVETAGAKMVMNPFDENAIESAVRMKEAGVATEVIAVSIGTAATQDVLRHALAMGVDRVVLVETQETLRQLNVAKLLRVVTEREKPDLVLLGKQAIDDDAGQTGQMLAGLLGWPQGTFASHIEIRGSTVEVTREIEGGTESVELDLPAVLTADLRLNAPRFVKLPNLMQAKKKPIETIAATALGVDLTPKIHLIRVTEPSARRAGVRVGSAEELARKLKDEAGVLQ